MPANAAKEFLDKYWDRNIPVDVRALAERAGVRVCEKRDLDGAIGMFSLIDNNPTINYSPGQPRVRERFTIAHELGHYVLGHGNSFRDHPSSFFSDVPDYRERQANAFAAETLMPEVAVKYLIMERNINDINVMSAMLDVSQAAMGYRLRNLGWIQ